MHTHLTEGDFSGFDCPSFFQCCRDRSTSKLAPTKFNSGSHVLVFARSLSIQPSRIQNLEEKASTTDSQWGSRSILSTAVLQTNRILRTDAKEIIRCNNAFKLKGTLR